MMYSRYGEEKIKISHCNIIYVEMDSIQFMIKFINKVIMYEFINYFKVFFFVLIDHSV